MKKCRITVLKKNFYADIVRDHSNLGPEFGHCPLFEEGQVFECGRDMPEGFCGWAWHDLHKFVFAALGGANFNEITMENFSKENHKIAACCTDGYRPVVFSIESFDV